MLRGIYTSATGMIAEMDRQNAIANNLANVNTVGFKKDNVTVTTFADMFLYAFSKQPPLEIGRLGLGVEAVSKYINYDNGALQDTGNPYDLAINGLGVFAIQTPNGVKYQRAGNFTIDQNGTLVTKDGLPVLGMNGPINLTGEFSINREGEIYQTGRLVDRLQIYDITNMTKEGEYFYSTQTAIPATNYQVFQGSLEHSNLNSVYEMVQMITATRSYEANQKALTAHDETLGRAVNDLAK